MMVSASYCKVGDVLGYTNRAYRWKVTSVREGGVTLRRILSDGRLDEFLSYQVNRKLAPMFIYEHAAPSSAVTVSSLDYMSDDNLSNEDKQIIKEALL